MSAVRTTLRSLLVLLGVVLVAACGIPTDGSPRPLADEASTTTTAPAPDTAGGSRAFTIVLVESGSETLVRVQRSEDVTPTAEVVLDSLLAGPTEPERELGISTQIPVGTTAVEVDLATDGTLSIVMSSEWEELVVGPSLYAYAQVVFSVTEVPGVDAVRFFVDDEQILAPTDTEGSQEVVTAADYRSLSPD